MPLLYSAAVQIRSITIGVDAPGRGPASACNAAGAFLKGARQAFEDGGFQVQTTRLCTQPIHQILSPHELATFARDLEAASGSAGIDYCAAGAISCAGPWTEDATTEAVVATIEGTERFFTSLRLDAERGVDPPAARAGAEIIRRVAAATDQGFGNLRFAGAARCPANVPFFPVAYHGGGAPSFSIAVQWADRLLEEARASTSLADLERRSSSELAGWGRRVQDIALQLESMGEARYVGLDLTPAPFPADDTSIAGAIESLGVARLGAPGTLTAVAALTHMLKEAPLRRCGFSGVMLPVLEDSILAGRVSEGLVSLSELLLYSAVCGTGLDTVPLPGDISTDELTGILADVATLAVALGKPLTARLFPVPGRAAGDLTTFDFPFFANGRVLATKGLGSAQLLRVMQP